MKPILSLAIGYLCLLSAGAGERYALVVGVDAYPGTDRLECARVDVPNVVGLLRETYQFPEKNIKVLRDHEATSAAIRQSFKTHLIDQVKPGDVAVFYFTGHGSTRPDMDGDEADGLDELICPVDFSKLKWDEMITDDDLGAWLKQINTRGIVVILDCCHSGTGTRSASASGDKEKYMAGGFAALEERKQGVRQRSTVLTKGASRGMAVEEKLRKPEKSEKPAVPPEMNHILLAACGAGQKALGSNRGSSFTTALVKHLRDKPDITYADLGRLVVPVVEDYARKQGKSLQTPHVEGRLDNRAFAEVAPGTIGVVPPPPDSVTHIEGFGPIPYRDFPLSVSVERSRYQINQLVTVNLVALEDCYVRLYHISADGVTTQILPNAFQRDNRLTGGKVVTIPPAAATFQFRVTDPVGVEVIRAIASTEQFDDLKEVRGKDFAGGTFMDLGAITPAETGRRGLTVEARPKPGAVGGIPAPPAGSKGRRSSAYVVYEVTKP